MGTTGPPDMGGGRAMRRVLGLLRLAVLRPAALRPAISRRLQAASQPIHAGFSLRRHYSTDGGIRSRMQTFLTRRRRPLTKDDALAILSWLFVGHGAFVLVGTTTFASVVLLVANSLQIQEWVACRIGRHLTRATGVAVTFGAAEPNWQAGKISFKDMRVVCGPPAPGMPDNYTQYDLTIESFDVNISLARLLEGRGLARTCAVSGVRGTVDRSRVRAAPGWRHTHQPGDWDLEGVSVRDLLVSVVSPDGFRPFSVSVLAAEMPRLRKHLLMHDLLAVHSAVGMFDRCLFSVHTPQIEVQEAGGARRKTHYSKIRHLKIDGLNVDHFSAGTTSGPMSWLQRGTVDIDAFVQLPANYREPCEDTLGATLDNIRENILLGILQKDRLEFTVADPAPPSLSPSPLEQRLGGLRDALHAARLAYLGPALERLRRRIRAGARRLMCGL